MPFGVVSGEESDVENCLLINFNLRKFAAANSKLT